MGRGSYPQIEPKLAYDYRRAILLVQMLANGVDMEALCYLAGQWGLPYEGATGEGLVQRMAEHALKYSREGYSPRVR